MGVRFGPGNLRFGIMHGLEGSTYRSFFAAESRRQQRTRGKRRLGNERRCSTWSWRRLCMSKIVPSMWYSKRFPEFQFSTSIHLLVGVILLQQSTCLFPWDRAIKLVCFPGTGVCPSVSSFLAQIIFSTEREKKRKHNHAMSCSNAC
jgi:hypothetical protein